MKNENVKDEAMLEEEEIEINVVEEPESDGFLTKTGRWVKKHWKPLAVGAAVGVGVIIRKALNRGKNTEAVQDNYSDNLDALEASYEDVSDDVNE